MKMIKLIQNETIKTFKRTSTKILILIAILSLLAAAGFSKAIISLSNFAVEVFNVEDEEWREQVSNEIKTTKNELNSKDTTYDKESKAQMQAYIEMCELALKYNINVMYYSGNFWKNEILESIRDLKVQATMTNKDNNNEINSRIQLLEKDDYYGYIEILKKAEKDKLDNKLISQEEYDDNIYLLELKGKYEINKEKTEMIDWKENVYNDIENIKSTLRTGINSTSGKLLKEEEIKKLEENLLMDEYRLKNNIPLFESMSSERTSYDMFAPSLSMAVVSILLIIIGGTSISGEITKGTIKFLLFTPNKRWKILLSKILSALFILITLTVVLSLLCVLIGNILFSEPGTEYLYVKDGEVHVLSNLTYMVLYFLASSIDIIVYAVFAFMLSVITRTTAVSVGVGIACQIGYGIVMNIINMFITADWIKYIPFNNLDFADRIFSNNLSFTAVQMTGGTVADVMSRPIEFSVMVIGVTVILMLVTMFDSFNKRDIV